MSSLTRLAHSIASKNLTNGDVAIDLTAGNGYDTLFLARCVAPTGRVLAFDIQSQAIDATRERLEQAGMLPYVSLHHNSHVDWPDFLSSDERNGVRAIMANLGYLPGGNASITTQASSTQIALEYACKLLLPGGILSVLVYTGHPGGFDEAEVVRQILYGNMASSKLQVDRFPEVIEVNSPILYLCKKPLA
jgi:predicted methyltransferase